MTDRPALKLVPLYAVLFDLEEDLPNRPQDAFVHAPTSADEATVPHGLDRRVGTALPALWYGLHLPNAFAQLADIPIRALKRGQRLDLGHRIFLAPVDIFTAEDFPGWRQPQVPVLAICPDKSLEDVAATATRLGFALPTISYSDLSKDALAGHWRAIHEKFFSGDDYFANSVALTKRLDLAALRLPHQFLKRQMTKTPSDDLNNEESLYAAAYKLQLIVSTFARMEEAGLDPQEAERQYSEVLESEARRLSFPVSLSLPGVPSAYSNRAYRKIDRRRIEKWSATDPADAWSTSIADRPDKLIERNAIEFVTTHSAIARSGIGLTLPSAPQGMFTHLRQLEQHLQGKAVGSTVWRLLERMDNAAEPLWTKEVREIVARATTLTVYSNFPIGLLTLPGDSSPLLTRVPVVYRPLLPLTRTIQSELNWVPPIELHQGFKVLVAECIPEEDPVGRHSRTGWNLAKEVADTSAIPINLEIINTSSQADLEAAIQQYSPDVLVISAHGGFDHSANVAGLVIGEELVLGPGLGPLPPVVILSACHVAPRGAATVSVADLLLREGAVAVLGTQIPVDVRRNALLMVRFFVYLSEVLNQRESYPTLMAAWHHVQTSNAVNDILDGNRGLSEWGHRATKGVVPLLDFMNMRSRGRLRRGNIYEDSELVLGEIADDQGVGAKVRNWFRSPGYVPESLFYVMIGSPERIYLRPFESAYE